MVLVKCSMALNRLFLHVVPMAFGLLPSPGTADILHLNITTTSTTIHNSFNVLERLI